MRYVKGLDTLRALAVLMVIHEHWGPHSFKFSSFLTLSVEKILPSGKFGVDFFFVLSGFLITGILIKAKDDAAHTPKIKILKNFVARRSLRIFPIYYLCIILLFFLDYPDVRKNFVYLATYTENFLIYKQGFWDAFCHTWSLAVEEQFYLIWPFIILFTPNKYILPVLISFVVASTAVGLTTGLMYGRYAIVLPYNCFNAFALGGIYAYAMVNNAIMPRLKQVLHYLLPVAILLYVAIECGFMDFPSRILNIIISINLIIYVVEAKYGRLFSAFINNNALVKMGQISYGIYLYHFCVPYLYYEALAYLERKFVFPSGVKSLFNHPGFAEIMHFIILIFISYFSYHFIEARFLKLKKNFNYNRPEKLAVSVAP
jgi:peptidoglycan/LPS O-acetylase OafA/YrhL